MADDYALVPVDDGDISESAPGGGVAEWAPLPVPAERLDYANNLAHVDYAFDAMSFWDKNEVAALRREWGGEAGTNLAYAHTFAQSHADIRDLVNREGMSDHPVIIRIAAMLGRRYGETVDHGSARAAGSRSGINDQIRTIRAQAREAAAEGDHRRANSLAERERDLIGQRDGIEPIVGSSGRNA